MADATPGVPAPEPRRLARLAARVAAWPLWVLLTVMALMLGTVIGVAAAAPHYIAPPPVLRTSVSESPTPSPAPTPPGTAPSLPALADAVRALETQDHVSLGVAIMPVFAGSTPPAPAWHAGTLTGGLAWATIDLPVAIAVAGMSPQPHDLTYLLDRAFSDASGAGDQALWQFLGDNGRAAAATTQVLRAGGDTTTVVPVGTTGTYPVFDQTYWALGNQATWLGSMYCMPDSWRVQVRLHQAPDDRAFGLATLPNAQTKTAWGTQDNGSLTLRQVGILPLPAGDTVAVTIAVAPMDGALTTATTVVDQLAQIIRASASGFGGTC